MKRYGLNFKFKIHTTERRRFLEHICILPRHYIQNLEIVSKESEEKQNDQEQQKYQAKQKTNSHTRGSN